MSKFKSWVSNVRENVSFFYSFLKEGIFPPHDKSERLWSSVGIAFLVFGAIIGSIHNVIFWIFFLLWRAIINVQASRIDEMKKVINDLECMLVIILTSSYDDFNENSLDDVVDPEFSPEENLSLL